MQLVIAFFMSAIAFGVLDFIWLSLMGPRLYRPQLGDLMGAGVNWGPAIAFYLIYVAAFVLLIVAPALATRTPAQALINGAIFGLAAYATYNLTNWATLRHWSAQVTMFDMAWGAIATGLACWIGVTLTLMFAAR
ncbi:MAG: DUF2177 family protein [Hyphomonadaceae bacterium]